MSRVPYQVLRHADYRRLAVSQGVSLIGTQMQVAAINWHVYLLTGEPLALGTLGLTRVLPLILFSLWGGIVADRHDRKRVIFLAQSGMTLLAAVLAWSTWTGRDALWLLYAINGLSAIASAFDNPARQALLPRLVPSKELTGALSLNLSAFNFATIAGPALAGLLLAGSKVDSLQSRDGLALIYVINSFSFLGVLLSVLRIRASGAVDHAANGALPFFASLREGLQFVFTTPIMTATMALDFFATFFAGSLLLLPIVADQILGVGVRGYGFLAAAPAVGALLGSLYTSLRPLPKHQGPVLLIAVVVYGAATIVVGLSTSFVLTLLALGVSGLADVISTVIRQTLRQLLTPDALRGRMTSINMIFFQGGPQLGEMEAGLVAQALPPPAFGTSVSITIGGVLTVLTAVVIDRLAPYVRGYRLPES